MNKIIVIIIVISLSISCSKEKRIKDNNTNSVCVIFDKAPLKKYFQAPTGGKSLFYNNMISYFYDNEKHFINPKKRLIKDSMAFSFTNSFLELNHDDWRYERINFLIKNNDTIILSYDSIGLNNIKAINNTSYRKYDLNYKLLIRKMLYKNRYTSSIKYLYPLPFVEYKKNDNVKTFVERYKNYKFLAGKQMIKDLLKEDLLLDSLKLNGLLSQKNYNYYKYINQIYRYYFKIDYYSNTSFIDSLLKNSDEFIDYSVSRRLLDKLVTSKFKIKKNKLANGKIQNYKSAFDSVNSNYLFPKKIKEYLLYTYLKQIADNFSIKDLNNYFEKFKRSVKDTVMVNSIKNMYLLDFSELKKETTNVHIINLKKEKTTLSRILENYRGKVIFIDFWASWCAPCRDAMSTSKKLLEKYKNKDIVFLYVSIDKDYNNWENASKQENIFFYKENLLAINYPSANFYKELKLKTIPRYLIFDKHGKLIHKNAPSPKTKELKRILDYYIENEQNMLSREID